MPCASCLANVRGQNATCEICGGENKFCARCIRKAEQSKKEADEDLSGTKKPKKLAAYTCKAERKGIPAHQAKQVLEKAREKASGTKRAAAVKKCVQPYEPPADAIVDKPQMGPSNPNDIIADPLKYVHIRANEIWKENPKLFNLTTAAVTIIECSGTRSVLLTSCVEGPRPLSALTRLAKPGEILVPPDPIVYRVRGKKTGSAKVPDKVFVARKASGTPAKTPGIDTDPSYAKAEEAMGKVGYTVVGKYPSADANETHAERRANAYAAANGCTVIAQAPTIGCCDLCQTSLGPTGLAKVPATRQSSASYNEYRRQTLYPTLDAQKKGT